MHEHPRIYAPPYLGTQMSLGRSAVGVSPSEPCNCRPIQLWYLKLATVVQSSLPRVVCGWRVSIGSMQLSSNASVVSECHNCRPIQPPTGGLRLACVHRIHATVVQVSCGV